MVRDANIFLPAATKIKPLGANHLKGDRNSALFVERAPVYVVEGASRSASASSSLNWISGDVISIGRKLCALIGSSREVPSASPWRFGAGAG